MKHHIIYISGLGDGYDIYRQGALRLWSLFGVTTHLVPMKWDSDESYESKYRRASTLISEMSSHGGAVSLVGESAGGSMAINLFAEHSQIASLVLIAGVNNSSTPVSQSTLRRMPAFAVSRQYVNESLRYISNNRRRHIHTFYAWSDGVVQPQYSQVIGAQNHKLWTVGHLFTIALSLTLLSAYVVHIIKYR